MVVDRSGRRAVYAAIVVAVCATAFADDAGTTRHLLTGVRAFKAGDYADALVELRLVARAPDAPADLVFYLGPTLYKLGRYREALAVFVTSRAEADALTDFYRGETCYQLRLYRAAHHVFAGLRTRGLGPVLDDAAARYVAAIDDAYRAAPTEATVDYYLGEGVELAASEPALAAVYLEEARAVEALAPARPRHAEIVAALGAAWTAGGRPREAIDLLAAEPARSADGTWQLARAYAALGDAAHARPLLDAIAKARGPHAVEAAGVSSQLPP